MNRIYLDTSCLNAFGNHGALNRIEEIARETSLALMTSTVNKGEQLNIGDVRIRQRYLDTISNADYMPGTGTIDTFIVGESMLGDDEIWMGVLEILGEPQNQNDIYDACHMTTAIMHECDVFLTLNKNDFIRGGRREWFHERFGIEVRLSQEFLKELERQ